MDKSKGLASQLARLVLVTGVGCILLFLASRMALRGALKYYTSHTDFVQRETIRLVGEFQNYVTEQQLSSKDVDRITEWAQRNDVVLLELYRNHVLIYSSFAPANEMKEAQTQIVPFYDWQPYARIDFSDGPLEALLYCSAIHAYETFGTIMLMMLCIALFLAIFLLRCRGIVRYIILLSQEIQAMEGGDLSHPVAIQGENELATLASCLDSMRLTLRSQHIREAETTARVKNLITEMSHDLRTPLTTLLLYTEILRCGKYQDEAQMQTYLCKIDEKARQIKYLSDNLFECALVTREPLVTLGEPVRFSRLFEDPLAELVDQLQHSGFSCELDLGSEDPSLKVYEPYLRRILDNILSNILKYGDSAQPVRVTLAQEDGKAKLCFCNTVRPDADRTRSTHIGLASVQTMMNKMQAESCTWAENGRFSISLIFEIF